MPGSHQSRNSATPTTGGEVPRRWQTLPGWTFAFSRKQREAVSCNHIICLWNSEKAKEGREKTISTCTKKSSRRWREMRTTFNLLLLPKPQFYSPPTAKHSSLLNNRICTRYFCMFAVYLLFLRLKIGLFPRVNGSLWHHSENRWQPAHKICQRLLLFAGWQV